MYKYVLQAVLADRWPKPGDARRMFDAFWTTHSNVSEFCGTEAWRKLQLFDSEISLKVIRLLLDQDITCIPLFDSFIVATKHEDALKHAMTEAVSHLSSRPGIDKKH